MVAQEVDCLEGLRKLYKHKRHGKDGNLRLLHVQNAPWATKFLLRKFNIDGRDELVSSNFGRYARSTKPERRGGKLFPNAKTWRVQHDPWRGIGKTSFGFEYLKEYETKDASTEGRVADEKMMELNGYDDEGEFIFLFLLPSTGASIPIMHFRERFLTDPKKPDSPVYGNDVYIQRLACYIQRKEEPPSPPFDDTDVIVNPYKVHRREQDDTKGRHHYYLPQLSSLDNEDAIIIFDSSRSGSFEDCLIPARSEWEVHWRRLPFYLAYEARELVGDDEAMGRQCARMILDDIFRALTSQWETLLNACHTHVSILEDKIYEQPADETRAPELWKNSSLWLQLEKLTTAHMAIVQEMRVNLRDLVTDLPQPGQLGNTGGGGNNNNYNNNASGSETASMRPLSGAASGAPHEDDWLEQIPAGFDRVASTVDEDLVKPTQALISLLYQSVSIRDSRLSLQIDTSMWRLSWITFIFLPLTFMVGFFGMNVDTFAGNPSMKWYFVASVPFMVLVLGGWYVMKHILARQRQTPYQRGTYETFFHELSSRYPRLWTRVGPREYIVPRTRLDKWKWWLVKRWTRPERTIKAGQANADTAAPSSLSRWSKIKMALIKHWSNNLTTFGSQADTEMLELDDESDIEAGSLSASASASALVQGLFPATELLTVPGQPVASAAVERLEEAQQYQRQHPQEQSHQPDDGRQGRTTAAANGNVGRASSKPPSPLRTAFSSEGPLRLAGSEGRRSEGSVSAIGQRIASAVTRGQTDRPTSTGDGSNQSRNSGVLVEEEDPNWIKFLATQGRGWYWKPPGQSPVRHPHSDGDRGRRGSGGSRPPEITYNIDQLSGNARPRGSFSQVPPSPRSSPPLGGAADSSGSGRIEAGGVEQRTRDSVPGGRSPLGISMTNQAMVDTESEAGAIEARTTQPSPQHHDQGTGEEDETKSSMHDASTSTKTTSSATQTSSDLDDSIHVHEHAVPVSASESAPEHDDDGTTTPIPPPSHPAPHPYHECHDQQHHHHHLHLHPSIDSQHGYHGPTQGGDGVAEDQLDHTYQHQHADDERQNDTTVSSTTPRQSSRSHLQNQDQQYRRPLPPPPQQPPYPRSLTQSPSNSNSATTSSSNDEAIKAAEETGGRNVL